MLDNPGLADKGDATAVVKGPVLGRAAGQVTVC